MNKTAEDFTRAVGSAPIHDDMERVNCEREGRLGHQQCGWCDKCDRPRFTCGHLAETPSNHR